MVRLGWDGRVFGFLGLLACLICFVFLHVAGVDVFLAVCLLFACYLVGLVFMFVGLCVNRVFDFGLRFVAFVMFV